MSRRRTHTQDRIAETAAVLFERHGYDGVTMEQIAAAADVARGTLYNHFPVKEAVLAHWMHARLAQDLQTLMPQVLARERFDSRMASLLEASADWWQEHPQYAAPYIRYRFQQVREGEAADAAADMSALYAGLIAQAQQAGELRADLPADRLARYLHYLYLCALMAWLAEPRAALADEFAHALEFFLSGAAMR